MSPVGLKLAVAHSTREGDNVADVRHTREVHYASFESETEACVASGAVLSEVELESVCLALKAELIHASCENVEVVFTLAAADDLADAGNEAVHCGNSLSIGI